MDIENHILIQIAFSVYKVSANQACLDAGISTNVTRARHLAAKLLIDHNHLSFSEIGLLFKLDADVVARGYHRLSEITYNDNVDWSSSKILKKYKQATVDVHKYSYNKNKKAMKCA